MKFLCNRDELLRALQVVTRALPVTTAIPELTHVLLELGDSSLSLSATNMKTYIHTSIASENSGTGTLLLQGQFFLELIQSLKDVSGEKIQLEVNPSNFRTTITMEGQSLKYELPGRSREEYPHIAVIEPEQEISIEGSQLKELLRVGSICSAATDNSIQGFRGICIDLKDSNFTIASMDGNRLVRVSRTVEGLDFEEPARWLLSMDVVSEILKVLPDENVLIKQSGNKFLLEFGSTRFQSLLSDAEFVDYEDYIPEELENGLEVDSSLFANQLRGLQPVARESGNRVVLEQQTDRVGMSSYSEKFGEGYRELMLENPDSEREEMTVAFNGKFILDYLSCVQGGSLKIILEGEGMPAYFWPTQNSQEFQHVCVIMSLSMH